VPRLLLAAQIKELKDLLSPAQKKEITAAMTREMIARVLKNLSEQESVN
jgi:hypothetical protein